MSSTNSNTVHPQVLRAGDAVALVSPAGPVDPRKIESAVEVLKSWGCARVSILMPWANIRSIQALTKNVLPISTPRWPTLKSEP